MRRLVRVDCVDIKKGKHSKATYYAIIESPCAFGSLLNTMSEKGFVWEKITKIGSDFEGIGKIFFLEE